MSALPPFDGLAERLQRARATYEVEPCDRTYIALLEADNAWLRHSNERLAGQVQRLGLRPAAGPAARFESRTSRQGG